MHEFIFVLARLLGINLGLRSIEHANGVHQGILGLHGTRSGNCATRHAVIPGKHTRRAICKEQHDLLGVRTISAIQHGLSLGEPKIGTRSTIGLKPVNNVREIGNARAGHIC